MSRRKGEPSSTQLVSRQSEPFHNSRFSKTSNLHRMSMDNNPHSNNFRNNNNDSPIMMADVSLLEHHDSMEALNTNNNYIERSTAPVSNVPRKLVSRHQSLSGVQGCENKGCSRNIKILEERVAKLQKKLEMTVLKIQELAGTGSLDSVKYMDYLNRVINLEKKSQKVQYTVWELKQVSKNDKLQLQQVRKTTSLKYEQTLKRIAQMAQDLAVYRNDKNEADQQTKEVKTKIESIRLESQKKMRQLFEAMEEMGNLQSGLVEAVNNMKKTQEYFNKENISGIGNNWRSPDSTIGSWDNRQQAATRKYSQHQYYY